MKRVVWSVLMLTAAGIAAADEGRPTKIIARGEWPDLPTHTTAGIGTDRTPRTLVIRTEAELAKTAGSTARITTAKEFKVDSIDFKKFMILAVEDGTQPMVGVSGGGAPSAPYKLVIVHVERDAAGKTLRVLWRRLPRDKEQVLTRPLEAVLIDQFAGDIRFKEE